MVAVVVPDVSVAVVAVVVPDVSVAVVVPDVSVAVVVPDVSVAVVVPDVSVAAVVPDVSVAVVVPDVSVAATLVVGTATASSGSAEVVVVGGCSVAAPNSSWSRSSTSPITSICWPASSPAPRRSRSRS